MVNVPCPTCGGTGSWAPSGTFTCIPVCRTCNGDGWIWVSEEAALGQGRTPRPVPGIVPWEEPWVPAPWPPNDWYEPWTPDQPCYRALLQKTLA